jgi:hypothetical protein
MSDKYAYMLEEIIHSRQDGDTTDIIGDAYLNKYAFIKMVNNYIEQRVAEYTISYGPPSPLPITLTIDNLDEVDEIWSSTDNHNGFIYQINSLYLIE